MRHLRDHRKLGRNTAHRRALLRNLVQSLFISESGRIKTTVEKAKEARRVADRMITLGKKETVHARRIARRTIPDRKIIRRLFEDIAPTFADRPGGYTRVLRIGHRQGDNAEMAYLELVGIAEAAMKAKAADDGKAKKGPEKKAAKATKTKAKPAKSDSKKAAPKNAPVKKTTRTSSKKGG